LSDATIILPGSDEIKKAIGNFCISFNFLEHSIENFIWRLLGNEQKVGQILTSQLGFSEIMALANALYQHKETQQEKIKAIEQMLKEADGFNKIRNGLMHCLYGVSKEKDGVTTISYRMKFRDGLKVFSVEVLPKNSEEINQTSKCIDILSSKFGRLYVE
jgi:hypothetical protein